MGAYALVAAAMVTAPLLVLMRCSLDTLPFSVLRAPVPTLTTTSLTPVTASSTTTTANIYVYTSMDLNASAHWENARVLGTKPAALTAVLNRVSKDEQRLFASIALFMPEAIMYVACTTPMVEQFSASTYPRPKLRLLPIMDEFKGQRNELRKTNKWVTFNAKRIDILRFALQEGHDGAWYMDGDTFLLAPLPQIAAPVGLSRHHMDPGCERTFGEWNSGYSFFRSFGALKTWDIASEELHRQHPGASLHQTTLRRVAQVHAKEFVELGCSINVGGFRMDPLISVGFKPYYDQVKCNHGVVQFKNCAIISGHWHTNDKNGMKVRPFMEKALRECHHPLLAAWLRSY